MEGKKAAWLMAALGCCVALGGCISAVSPPEATPAAIGSPALAVPSFSRDILPMYAGSCNCHGYEAGRFDPSDYAGTLGVVVPSDPEASQLVQMMREGHHAPGLSEEELELVIRWIEAGAPYN